jgi:hypothetical protein
MTYLYNADLGHYDQDYWPTVNSYRLPGTTVDTQTLADGAYNWSFSTQSWVGSANILGLYGTAGMQLMTQGSTLTANKSWFMFDDEIVALGSDINSSDNRTIETIVENRHIASTDNALTVNGVAQATTVPWSTTLTNVNWMHLAGSAASGADIGYFFPASAVVQALRETRSSSWSTIKTTESTNTVTGNYVTLWLDHGANPAEATYAYVLLPNKSASQVGAYATNPDIAILEQSSVAHAVKEKTLNVIGANFWQDVSHSVDMITSDRKAIVMTQENPHQDLTVAVADPTQLGSSIDIEITRSASDIITADNTITITQLSPTIKFTVNVSNALGHTQNVKFNLGSSTNPPSAPANLSATAVSTSGINLAWTASTDAASYAVLRSTTNGGPYTNIAAGLLSTSYRDTGLAGGATYYYLVQAINSAGTSPASAQASAATWAPLTTTLSINFQGTGTAMATTESAGVVAAGNWNNAAGASGSLSSLADKNGVVTAAAVSWSSHNTWSTPITDTAGSKRMMKGYLDNSDTSTTSVTVSGLPSSYTVYVYCDGDNRTTTKTGIYMIGNTNITATDTGNVNFSGTFVQANNSAGNYIVFPNQTASSFTLTATGTSTDPGPRAPINGIQIVPTGPQPLTTTLSINFQGNGTAMATTESAGVVAAGNWNNAAGTSGALSSMADKNGTATTVSVNWSSNDTWSTPITDTAGNNRMMKGYLDTSNASTTSVIVSGLPSTYTVYLYCDGYNNTAKRTGRYTLGNTTVTATDAASTNFSGTFVQANNSAGNYIVFPNQTASSFTITATGTSTDTTPRAPINGIQIVP